MVFIPVTRGDIEHGEVEPGTYPARIDKITERKSQAGNKVYLIRWVITGSEPPAGQSIIENVTLVPEAYWKLGEIIDSIGFQIGDQGFNTEDILGMECNLQVIHEEYQGRTRPKVEKHLPL